MTKTHTGEADLSREKPLTNIRNKSNLLLLRLWVKQTQQRTKEVKAARGTRIFCIHKNTVV